MIDRILAVAPSLCGAAIYAKTGFFLCLLFSYKILLWIMFIYFFFFVTFDFSFEYTDKYLNLYVNLSICVSMIKKYCHHLSLLGGK